MKPQIRKTLFILVFSIVGISCATLRSINVFPASQDIELGLQVDKEIRGNPKEYPLLENKPTVTKYVDQLGRKILASPEIKYRDSFAYKFEIIHDDSTVNAFCTPGGYVYVYTGLMKFLDNEATLAGVIAHEIAHAECRHATKRMTAALGAEVLVQLILGEKPSELAVIGANLFSGLGLLANSRADETEADQYSFKYLQSTEYYPGAIQFFFAKVLGPNGSASKPSTFERLLSTHPLPQDRVESVKKMLAQIGNPKPSEAQLLSVRYQQLKKILP